MKPEDSHKKLLPLRKFAKHDGYSTAYLSQLVQRKKLKAQKIGRNYFTCQAWFNDYLELHARGKKQANYQAPEKQKSGAADTISEISKLAIEDNKANFFVLPESFNNQLSIKPKRPIIKRIAATTAIFILLLTNMIFIYQAFNRGEIAGVEDENNAVSTTTGQVIHLYETD